MDKVKMYTATRRKGFGFLGIWIGSTETIITDDWEKLESFLNK